MSIHKLEKSVKSHLNRQSINLSTLKKKINKIGKQMMFRFTTTAFLMQINILKKDKLKIFVTVP